MTIVKKIIVTYIPDKCVLCDFCIYGTHQDIDLGCECVCVAGRLNRQGKECLTEEEVLIKRPDWCPLSTDKIIIITDEKRGEIYPNNEDLLM